MAMPMDPNQRIMMALMAQQGNLPGKLVPKGAQPLAPGFEMLPQGQGDPGQGPVASALMGPPSVQMPVGMGGETRSMPMGVGPVPEAPNPVMQALRGMGRDIASDPVGAVTGPLEAFAGSVAPVGGTVIDALTTMRRGPLRAATEAEGDALQAVHRREAVDLSMAPHWQLQTRNGNKFGTYPPEVKAAREQGIAARAAAQRARDAAAKKAAEDAETAQRMQEHLRSPKYMEETERFRRANPPNDDLIQYRGKAPKRL
jgi:hypothetical protein